MRTVVYTGTRNLYPEMEVACKSLLYHDAASQVLFLIEDDAFPTPLPDKVRCVNVSGQTFFRHDGPNFGNCWTYMTMMKAAVPFIEGVSGKVLVLDVDTIVHEDLTGLWGLSGKPLYLAREKYPYAYYNSGVMLMDTDDQSLRDDLREVIRRLNEKHYGLNEQDAINEVMEGRIATLPPEYNVSEWTVMPQSGRVAIEHYAGMSYWRNEKAYKRYEKVAWEDIVRR